LRQPEVRSQYEALKSQVKQWGQWQRFAQVSEDAEFSREEIYQMREAYLDGQQIPKEIYERMQRDLQKFRQQQQQ